MGRAAATTATAATPRIVELARHLEGCPSDPNRIETYPAEKPGVGTVQVIHCVECGEVTYPTPEKMKESAHDEGEDDGGE